MRRIGLVAVAAGLLIGADGPKKDDAGKDIEGLQGTWAMTSLVMSGEAVPEGNSLAGKLVVEGDRYTVSVAGQVTPSTFKLDPSRRPRQIDFVPTSGPQKGQTLKGIYELDGNTYRLCRGLRPEDERPTGFSSPPGSAVLLVVWKRAEHGAGADRKLAGEELARFQGTWQLISAETDGEKVPQEWVKKVRITFAGNTHTVRLGDQVIVHDVRFEIDPSSTPSQVTDTINDGPDKGKQIRGIYKLEGDTLTSCVAPAGKDRPTAFAADKGSGHTLRVFQHVKPSEGKGKAVEDELRRFEGNWKITSLQIDGKAMPAEGFEGAKLVLKGDSYAFTDQGGTGHGTFTVDPASKPKTIEISFSDGPEAGKMIRGIYELEGDTYKLCFALQGKDRPTEFTSKPGSGHILEVLTRVKP
jgi:uncharacterized protein (TIGR03067 family)